MNPPPPPAEDSAYITNRDLYHMLVELKSQVDSMTGALKFAAILTPVAVTLIVFFASRGN